ncbi:MAG TPA: LysM peptidoglycan-binding domain-containing protein [Verrucomicrobiae bacterium]|jgi:LysM repeat protein|nr:LysM peptidoglycan-binding domain-containing protein [Verrucomicrobiae bacterium]
MRGRLILTVSIGLNVVLAILWLAPKRHPRTAPVVATNVSVVGTNGVRTLVTVRKQFFSWQELESADYPTFIANLRNIECPEQTIRDIIVADVNQLYAHRRETEVPTPDQQWWRADPDTNALQAISAKLNALDQERRALLTTLLGPNWDATDNPPRPLVALTGPVLGELSPETKNAVQEVIARSQQRTQAYLDAQKAAGKTPDPVELARLGLQTRTDLAQILNPTQLEEFLLRYSENAASLRQQLRGIDVSPDEFRALFRLVDPIDNQIQLAGGSAQDREAQQASLAKQLVDALKSVLGPDRYQAYQIAQDPLYRDAAEQVENAGANPAALQALYQLNKATADAANRIRNDPALTADQKTAQLQALEDQKQASSDQILGLTPPPEPPAPPTPPPAPPSQQHAYSPGETVDQIAAKFGVTPASILNANPNLNFNNLTRGAIINIPAPQ